MTRPSFWSEPVRLWLKACGRQDLADRGDALAQRVTALLVAVRQRADQYLEHDDLYSGAGGDGKASADPAQAAAALAELDQFVNVRLRQEVDALEAFLSVFDDLRTRSAVESGASPADVCDRLSSSVSDDNLAGFFVGYSYEDTPAVVAMTVMDPGPGARGLAVDGVPFSVRRAPRSLRRRIFSQAT